MSDKINRALHGVIKPGKCFHEWKEKFRGSDGYQYEQCINCPTTKPLGHRGEPYSNPDYFSKEGFWDVWKWLIKQELFNDFRNYGWKLFEAESISIYDRFFYQWLFNYKVFAKHLYDFLVAEGIIKGDG